MRSCLRSRPSTQLINIRSGNELAIGVDRDLDRTVAHLILHVGDGLVGVETSAEEIAESKRLRDKLERALFFVTKRPSLP